jgi:hypothetical protein
MYIGVDIPVDMKKDAVFSAEGEKNHRKGRHIVYIYNIAMWFSGLFFSISFIV